MGKPMSAASSNPLLTPDQFPDWVLSFNTGFFPLDPAKQEEQHAKFKTWQVERAIWFEAQGIRFSSRECGAELRRRAAAWQLLHPDRGPIKNQIKENEKT